MLAPLVFMIPPHIEWVVLTVGYMQLVEMGAAPPIDPARREQSDMPDRPVGERRPLRIWSPAGSDW